MSSPLLASTQRPAFWRWALVVLLSAGVVVGLLGMHVLSSGHAEHVGAGVAVVAEAHDHAAENASDASGRAGSECAECAPPDALALVCVLGLLVTLLLIVRPRPCALVARYLRFAAALAVGSARPCARPPSLHELSISRT